MFEGCRRVTTCDQFLSVPAFENRTPDIGIWNLEEAVRDGVSKGRSTGKLPAFSLQ